MPSLSQRQRLIAAGFYFSALLALGIWAHDGWPPLTGAGAWFYTAGIALLLSVLISEPFYTSPAAAFGNSAALILVALLADLHGLEASQRTITEGRWSLVGIAGFVLLCSVIAMATYDRLKQSRINRIARLVATRLGAGYFLYGLAFVAGVYATFADEPERLAALYISLIAFTTRPVERLIAIWPASGEKQVGDEILVSEVHDPGLALLRSSPAVLAVGDRVQAAQHTGTVIDATQSGDSQWSLAAFAVGEVPGPGSSVERQAAPPTGRTALGYVARGTTLDELQLLASSSVSSTTIEEGHLLTLPIRDSTVLFQVTGARVEEASLGEAKHAVFRITAQKLGMWNEATSRFELVPWLPIPGGVVELEEREETHFDPDLVGCVPGSRYGIHYQPARAVTHNTAILGVLGSGKTTLAQELICRNLAAGIKVLVLDITRQHATRFASLNASGEMDARHADFDSALATWHGHATRDADNYFGSEGEFRRLLKTDIAEFLDGCDKIRVYNPLAFTATTIEGFPRNQRAEDFRELSTVEKTSAIAQALLGASTERGETPEPRVCLVLEEGHSLVPEPSEGLITSDQRAVSSAARAVLQGRKYGFGCLLITQRTANVTKTILNQCHTVFALRSYDATGIAFLANYFGDSYSKVISSIPQYHAVAFGEGVNCIAPIIVELNDPAAFNVGFWDLQRGRLSAEIGNCREESAAENGQTPVPDDIPF